LNDSQWFEFAYTSNGQNLDVAHARAETRVSSQRASSVRKQFRRIFVNRFEQIVIVGEKSKCRRPGIDAGRSQIDFQESDVGIRLRQVIYANPLESVTERHHAHDCRIAGGCRTEAESETEQEQE